MTTAIGRGVGRVGRIEGMLLVEFSLGAYHR